jgi:protein-disulfide isomerase
VPLATRALIALLAGLLATDVATRPAFGQAAREGAAPGVPLELFIRRFDALGPGVKVQVGGPKPAPIAGLELVPVYVTDPAGRTRMIEVLRSADGRHVVIGRFEMLDVTRDPMAGIARAIDLKDRASLGRDDAPVTVVEYSDFQCPYCRKMSPVVHETIKGPRGKEVRWVYKHFPLTSIHPWAEPAAVAAECARRVGGDAKFWALHDHYFAEQEKFTAENHRDRAIAWAKGAGISAARFASCLDGKEALERVRADLDEGRRLGISSTPTLVINGVIAPGTRSTEEIAALVEQELAYQRALRASGG